MSQKIHVVKKTWFEPESGSSTWVLKAFTDIEKARQFKEEQNGPFVTVMIEQVDLVD